MDLAEAPMRVFNPTAEDAHWRAVFRHEPYYRAGLGFDDYGAAFRVGYTGPLRRAGPFDDIEDELRDDWLRVKGRSRLTWDQARPAVRAAWSRVADN